jgi:hypothetical protein
MCPYNQPYIAGSVICSTKPHSKLLASVRVIVVLVSPRVMLCFVDRCLSFCPFSFGHCGVCPSLYGFWLPLGPGSVYDKWNIYTNTTKQNMHPLHMVFVLLSSTTSIHSLFCLLWTICWLFVCSCGQCIVCPSIYFYF